MVNKFKCKVCARKGDSYASPNAPFPHYGWYEDAKGLKHNCLYCRECGTIYDTIGSLIGLLKWLFGRMPSTVVGQTDIEYLIKITRIGNEGIPDITSLHPIILQVMEDDGRLEGIDEIVENKFTKEELEQLLQDDSSVIRREAEIALRNY